MKTDKEIAGIIALREIHKSKLKTIAHECLNNNDYRGCINALIDLIMYETAIMEIKHIAED